MELPKAADLPVVTYDELVIRRSFTGFVRSGFRRTGGYYVILDGRRYACSRGAWATWIPQIETKFLHSVEGRIACHSRHAPSRQQVLGEAPDGARWGSYSFDEWRQAYAMPAVRRVAENVVAALRLHAAGLGPGVLGLCLARRFRNGAHADSSFAVGFMIENAAGLPPKEPASETQLVAAGVQPDRIRSAVRQQVNGYVVDLNSVVGVVPIDAEAAVAAVEAQILANTGQARMK